MSEGSGRTASEISLVEPQRGHPWRGRVVSPLGRTDLESWRCSRAFWAAEMARCVGPSRAVSVGGWSNVFADERLHAVLAETTSPKPTKQRSPVWRRAASTVVAGTMKS